MKQSKLLEFIKQWKSLEHRAKDLDFERSRWCADLRAEFAIGSTGDKAFGEWLSLELGLPEERREECLERAQAFAIVPDQHQWESFGGNAQIRKLISLDKKERVAVIGAAKATGYRIGTIVRQRESKPVTPHQLPAVVRFAEWIESREDAPAELREEARSYIRAKALKVAS